MCEGRLAGSQAQWAFTRLTRSPRPPCFPPPGLFPCLLFSAASSTLGVQQSSAAAPGPGAATPPRPSTPGGVSALPHLGGSWSVSRPRPPMGGPAVAPPPSVRAAGLGTFRLEADCQSPGRHRRPHRGAGVPFCLGVLWSNRVSSDIPKGRPGSRHGGQGLPLLPHRQEGELQPGGIPRQQSGQGRRGRDFHLDFACPSVFSPCVTVSLSTSHSVCSSLSLCLSHMLLASPSLHLSLSVSIPTLFCGSRVSHLLSVPAPLALGKRAAASGPGTPRAPPRPAPPHLVSCKAPRLSVFYLEPLEGSSTV